MVQVSKGIQLNETKQKNKVFYNFVIPEDLWYMAAYYYNRYGLNNKYDTHELCNMPLDDIKCFCIDGIKWLEEVELPYVDVLDSAGYSPDKWVTLYYMIIWHWHIYRIIPIREQIKRNCMTAVRMS